MPMTPFSAWKMTSRSVTKSETLVGMPMPRLTNQPSGMSRAMRRAMPSRSSGVNSVSAIGRFLKGVSCRWVSSRSQRHVQHALHENAGGVDVFGLDRTEFDDVRCLRDRQLRRHRHYRIVVPRAVAMREVAETVGL